MFDLVYTDRDHKDQGVIQAYSLDAAWGSDENDFELVLPAPSSHREGVDADRVLGGIEGEMVAAYPESVDNKAVSLEVDGKAERVMPSNLMQGTDGFSGAWVNKGNWTDGGTYNGLAVLKRGDVWGGVSQDMKISNGKTYTFSAYAKADDGVPVTFYLLINGDTETKISGLRSTVGTITYSTTVVLDGSLGSWTRFSATFTAAANGTVRPRFEVRSASSGKYLYVCGYKFEQGATATEYEPYFEPRVDTVRGKNLLDLDSTMPAFLNGSGLTVGSLSDGFMYVAKVEPNTTYTFSRATTTENSRFGVAGFASYPKVGDSWANAKYSGSNPFQTKELTFTTGADIHYVALFLDRYATERGTGYQLERGSIATDYEPYNTIAVKTATRNLLPPLPALTRVGQYEAVPVHIGKGKLAILSTTTQFWSGTSNIAVVSGKQSFSYSGWSTANNGARLGAPRPMPAGDDGYVTIIYRWQNSNETDDTKPWLQENMLQVAENIIDFDTVMSRAQDTVQQYNLEAIDNGDGTMTVKGTSRKTGYVEIFESTYYGYELNVGSYLMSPVEMYGYMRPEPGVPSRMISGLFDVDGYERITSIRYPMTAGQYMEATFRPFLARVLDYEPHKADKAEIGLTPINLLTLGDKTTTSGTNISLPGTFTPGMYTFSFESNATGAWQIFSGDDASSKIGTYTLAAGHNEATYTLAAETSKMRLYVNVGGTFSRFAICAGGSTSSVALASLPDGTKDTLTVDEDGNAYIEKLVGVVDLGALTWSWQSGWLSWYAEGAPDARRETANAAIPNIIHGEYETSSLDDAIRSTTTSKVVSLNVSTPYRIMVKNGSTTEKPSGLLYYELATPQRIALDPVTMPTLFANGTVTLDATMPTRIAAGYELSPASRSYEVLDVPSLDFGALVYVDGTQLGGVVDDKKPDGTRDVPTVTYHGRTWHGIMAYSVIQPNAGQDYYTYSGDANDVIRAVITKQGLGSIFECVGNSGITVSGRFDRYTDMYSGLLKMLSSDASKPGKLAIEKQPGGKVRIGAVEAASYTSDVDSDRYGFKATLDYRPVNHLICLGKGDLKARDVVHFYADANGNVSQTQTLFGIDERCMTYDSSNSDHADLVQSGREKLVELQDTSSIEMTVTDGSFDVGDIVGALDNLTGIYVESTVAKVVASVGERGMATYSYEVGDIITRRGTNVPANKL